MNKEFSQILKNLRKNSGYTQKELSELLGVGQTTVANYENGVRIPDIGILVAIANVFNVSLDELIGRRYYKDKSSQAKYSYEDYFISLLNGDINELLTICSTFLEKGMDYIQFYKNIIERSLTDIGVLWEKGEIDIWQEHFVSENSIKLMEILFPRNIQNNKDGKTIIGITGGAEMHNIGLRMVCNIFQLSRWNAIYLGSHLPTQNILNSIKETRPKAIALSVTQTYHIESTQNLISAIRQVYKKDSPSIILGGAAFKNIDNVAKVMEVDYFFNNIDDINPDII